MVEKQETAILHKVVLQDKSLTLKAKAMIIFMASKPKGTLFSVPDFLNKSNDQNTSIKTGFYELEEIGYIIRSAEKGTTRRFNYFVNQEMFEID